MKNIFLISVLFAISVIIPIESFAEKPTSCTFGDESTSPDNIFEKDFAVKPMNCPGSILIYRETMGIHKGCK